MEKTKDWLNVSPLPESVKQNPDGSEYIDILTVVNDLDELDPHWGAENFKYRTAELDGRLFGSASLQLIVFYEQRTRRIVGAATVELIDHLHSEPTLVSECIKNAAKKLGRRFGKYLNDRGGQQSPVIQTDKSKSRRRESVLLTPNAERIEIYKKAKEENNRQMISALEAMYDFSNLTSKEDA